MKNCIATRLGSATRLLWLFLLLLPAANHAAAQTTEPTLTAELPPTEEPLPTAEASPTRVAVAPGRFGVIESYEDPAAADRLGASWTRVRFQWAEVQPRGPDEFRSPLDDESLAAELAVGREVVGLLIGIPAWARDRQGLPRGLSLPHDDPNNTWAAFVGETVARYAGRIDRWIIWNEPDIDDPDAPGHTWDGDVAEFAQLQRTAYLAARDANRDAVVHLGAFTYFWDPGYFDRFLDELDADPAAGANDYYFDVATAHLYFQPNGVYNVLHAFERIMAAHGLDKPIWLVETNAPPMNDPYWEVPNWTLAVTLNEQAAFIPQALAAALAAGAERVAVYKLKDTEGDRAANPEPFGLMRWDESRRPAFDTYRVAIRLLAGVRSAERERWDAVAQVRLDQQGQTTTVLFARLPEPQTALVPALASSAELVDMWGRGETVEADDGTFRVDLPGALCTQTIADYCMIGGTTYYLIQDTTGPRPTLRPTSPSPEEAPEPTSEAPTVVSTAPSATISPSTTEPAPETARPTATVQATATVRPTDTPAPTAGPVAEPDGEPPDGSTPAPAATAGLSDYLGLILIGAGLLLAMGMFAIRRVGRGAAR